MLTTSNKVLAQNVCMERLNLIMWWPLNLIWFVWLLLSVKKKKIKISMTMSCHKRAAEAGESMCWTRFHFYK